ncbi:hypothetical protein RHS03_01774, partial [Rhizoctonia solani]
MGEFPEPAIQGSPVLESTSAPITSISSSQPIPSTDPSPSVESSSQSETNASFTPISTPTPVTTKVETSFSHAPSTTKPSTTVELQTSALITRSPTTTSFVQSTPTFQSTSVFIPQPTSIQIVTPASAPISIPTTSQRISTPFSTIKDESTSSGASSVTEIVTRPIITPVSTQPPPLATTAPTANSHLSLGPIVGIVAAIVIVLAIIGTCIILGPRRALRKVGIGANRDEEKIDYEEWEPTHRESGTWTGRPTSVGANSDWWRPPPGAFPTRPSTMSLGGPGMAGVGAGKSIGMDGNPASPIPRRMSQRRIEERGAIRSGWFATSMVRGASLLSLGSLVRPIESSNSRGSERMSRMGTGGSAGKRFQELYRRERASGSSGLMKSNEPTQYLATINEMGVRQPSEMGQYRVPGGISSYRPRTTTPKVRRPSQLAMSYVPDIVVRDATLPNLSSVSSVTHESGGRGYDGDAEVERRPRADGVTIVEYKNHPEFQLDKPQVLNKKTDFV